MKHLFLRAVFTVLALPLAMLMAGNTLAPGEAKAQPCISEAAFIAGTKTQLAHYGERLQVGSMDVNMARAYFAELDKKPPVTTTPVDGGYLILIRGNFKVGAVPVKEGVVCGHYTVGIVVHMAILRTLGLREHAPGPEPGIVPDFPA